MNDIFLGEPPANIKQWIIDHSGSAGHADTWYKYANDSEWRTVSITGSISGSWEDEQPTTQIPNVTDIVALEIGTSVTSIEDQAFRGCSGLTSVTIPDSVTIVGASAFAQCSGLTSMTLPGVTQLFIEAFGDCSRLQTVTIGNNITNIQQDAFYGCSSLTSVTFLGKTIAQVEAMNEYPWGIEDTSIINVA